MRAPTSNRRSSRTTGCFTCNKPTSIVFSWGQNHASSHRHAHCATTCRSSWSVICPATSGCSMYVQPPYATGAPKAAYFSSHDISHPNRLHACKPQCKQPLHCQNCICMYISSRNRLSADVPEAAPHAPPSCCFMLKQCIMLSKLHHPAWLPM
jgi:hypothetical protein